VEIPGYTDFYSSKEHATNVGSMFRDPKNALLPNWSEMPIGYNGRASSIILSGQDVRRPKGQINRGGGSPEFSPSQQLDFELEVGFLVGKNTAIGSSVSAGEAEDCIFGLVLVNDWSARDIQRWEYVPLGPFLGKSFAKLSRSSSFSSDHSANRALSNPQHFRQDSEKVSWRTLTSDDQINLLDRRNQRVTDLTKLSVIGDHNRFARLLNDSPIYRA